MTFVIVASTAGASAQVCGPKGCGRQPTVEACVECYRAHQLPYWTESGMLRACQKIVPECHKATQDRKAR